MNEGATTGRAILVLGAHRSGTSLVTRVLNLLGAALPDRLVPANASNERGHWEPQALVALNDAILSEVGTTWDDWSGIVWDDLPQERTEAWIARLAEAIAAEYGARSPLLLKDPRICRMLPLYDAALARLGIVTSHVIVLRDPAAAAASLAARDDIVPASGALLWLRHLLDAEHITRGRRRIFVRYEDLLEAPDRSADRLAAFLHLETSEAAQTAIRAFVTPGLAHHSQTMTTPFAKGAYAALLALAKDQQTGDGTTVLNACRARLDDFARDVPTRCQRGTRLVDALLDERKHVREEIAGRDAESRRVREALAASEHARSQAEARLVMMEASASWRLTAGLRAAKAWLYPRPIRRTAP